MLALYLLVPALTLAQNLDVGLISGHFKEKHLHFVHVFHCLDTKDEIALIKLLFHDGIRMSTSKISNCDLDALKGVNQIGVIVDFKCDKAEDLLLQAGKSALFHYRQHWLIQAPNNSILNMFSRLNLNINSDVLVALPPKGTSDVWTILDAYNTGPKQGGQLNISEHGSYDQKHGVALNRKESKLWARRNMTHITLDAVIVIRRPTQKTIAEYLQDRSDLKYDSFLKFHCNVMHVCRDFYNFSFNLIKVNDWGFRVSKNVYDGMAGVLHRQEADMGCSALYLKPERIQIMDFSTGLWDLENPVVFRQPAVRSFGQVFLHPMASGVWFATLAAGSLIVVSLRISQKFEAYLLKKLGGRVDSSWSSVLLFSLGAFCQQGTPQNPHLVCGRIITISVLLFCFLFYQFYSGSIVSSLLIKPPSAIKTYADLLKSPLGVGAHDITYLMDYIRTTKAPVIQAIFNEKMMSGNSSGFYPAEVGLKLVEKGGFAFEVEQTMGYVTIEETFSEKAICELGEVAGMLPKTRIMTPLAKGSPFKDMMSHCMQRILESGLGGHHKRQWSAQKPQCLPTAETAEFQVQLGEIYPAMVFLWVGILVSLTVLLLEVLISKDLDEWMVILKKRRYLLFKK